MLLVACFMVAIGNSVQQLMPLIISKLTLGSRRVFVGRVLVKNCLFYLEIAKTEPEQSTPLNMDVDQPLASSSALSTSLVLQTMPKIDENVRTDNKPPKEKILELLDLLESHVEKLRKEAAQLEEDRDQLLATLDSVRHTDLMNQLDDNDADDVTRYAERIMSRCQTVEVRVLTQRDQMQEEALSQINYLIDGLVMDLRSDHDAAKQRCISYVNACSSIMVDGIMDKTFESTLLGCTLDDQKRVKKRLQGLLSYFERLRVQMFE